MPGILRVVLGELTLKIVRWKRRGALFRNCIWENSQTQMTVNVGESILGTECVQTHLFPSSQMEIGTAAGADAEETFEGGCGKTSAFAVQAEYRSISTAAKVKEERIVLERDSGRKRAGGKGDTRGCWSCGKRGHMAAKCLKGNWNRSLNAVEEDEGDISEEHEDDDELQAWFLLEESENEQWQEVTSKKSNVKTKKFAHESLLRVEDNSCASPRKVIEVKDKWVNFRATMDTGVAGHVMPTETFPRVKLDRTTTTEKHRRLG